MANNPEHIDAKALPPLLENFALLRERALNYIQQTTAATWTDHNIHDPGITILEALCYALSDVGYRMNFPVADLLTDEKGNLPREAFYTPTEILPCHPVTINDFRKVLIDLPLVKNAWITPVTTSHTSIQLDYEPMYVYTDGGRLVLAHEVAGLPLSPTQKTALLGSQPVFLHGLYAVHIEFEPQPLLGAIDSGEGFEGVYEKEFFGDIFYDIGNWTALANNPRILQQLATAYHADPASLTLQFVTSPRNQFNNNDGKLDDRVLSEWYYDLPVLVNGTVLFTFKDVRFQPYLENRKGISGKDLKVLLSKNDFRFFSAVFDKIEALAQAYADVRQALHRYRNLCEDYLPQIAAIPTMDFRVCADIDVTPGADIEQVQAEIFYRLEQYISPTIPFYTIDELAAKGIPLEAALEGPLLAHGFVLEAEMGENSFQQFTIHLSDVINAMYEIDGLQNCRNVSLVLTDGNGHTVAHDKWVVAVPNGFKPVLNKRKSKLLFYKNNLPLTPNFRESILKLGFLQTAAQKSRTAAVPFPNFNQTYRQLALHYSLADEFPATYRIGKNLPDAFLDKPELYASKQLEGYLLLFDQLIANFLTDLHHLRDSLSWSTVTHLNYQSAGNSWRRPYLLGAAGDSRWQTVVESPEAFVKKRNDSLDYLLSRFAENLQDIDNHFFLATDNLNLSETEYYNSLITLKQRFLANYISISANRGAAVNLLAGPEYGKVPPSGYEDRLSRLLGCELVTGGRRRGVADLAKTDKAERGYFHVLEHLLLRMPTLNNEVLAQLKAAGSSADLLGICTDDDCTACGGEDPHSFIASVVLPAWLPVYADVHYRDFAERLIRRETPVGVLLRICWLSEDSMTAYETAVGEWWAARYTLVQRDAATYNNSLLAYLKKQNALVQVLKAQRSQFFPATLHGCEDEGEENNTRVFLDQTFLG
ncbi:hypothetical protein SAMN05444008_105192 [Cnuella takakiae]|uniref:Uncharacterized protein n=1 Tax=Cnuella takakiae TaxID=1302690 RepID=A0A1M4ZE78_9BACT|nr:hypothetical protein [Cnuella takakiae]OLY94236.1 hypothetical protein BUE76_21875 [Cnuella takakiae]SHF16320.1 hypothetical protein SAMN05444008_105192 [Cnuella takakiae]